MITYVVHKELEVAHFLNNIFKILEFQALRQGYDITYNLSEGLKGVHKHKEDGVYKDKPHENHNDLQDIESHILFFNHFSTSVTAESLKDDLSQNQNQQKKTSDLADPSP